MSSWQLHGPHGGHAHFFERATAAGMSRRQFLRRGAVAAGGLAGLGLLDARSAFGQSATDPKPIPGGFDENFTPVPSDPFIHILPAAVGFEMSTITDFTGFLGAAEIQGTAHGSDNTAYTFDADMRFMKGQYIATDGRLRAASFGFV
jgi:hypothetical protein